MSSDDFVGVPYTRGSDASRDAAERMLGQVDNIRRKVFAVYLAAGERGLTDHEVLAILGGVPSTTRTRRKELVRLGLVVETEQRRTTPSGCRATVWRIAA